MSRNLEIVKLVAHRLEDLRQEVVFLGGAVTALLINAPGVPDARPTDDVDVIVDLASHAAYAGLSARLRKLGFKEDTSEGAPVCRWLVGGVKVDVMPTSAAVLGFGNRWYAPAIEHAVTRKVGKVTIKVVSAPYFLATKLEAFDGRGEGDYQASHDLEDFIAVVDGRSEVLDEVKASPKALQGYLAQRVGALLDEPLFRDALPGHLPGDQASQRRVPLVLQRLRKLAGRP